MQSQKDLGTVRSKCFFFLLEVPFLKRRLVLYTSCESLTKRIKSTFIAIHLTKEKKMESSSYRLVSLLMEKTGQLVEDT